MADVTYDLHVALLAKLKELCSCEVWDSVPQDADFPYVVIDSAESSDVGFISGTEIDERFVYLSIWSRVHGQREVMQIIGNIQAIHMTSLPLASGQVVSVRLQRSGTNREPDGLTFMGRATLRILTRN